MCQTLLLGLKPTNTSAEAVAAGSTRWSRWHLLNNAMEHNNAMELHNAMER